MNVQHNALNATVSCLMLLAIASSARGQAPETFTATAAIKTAGNATANAPITVIVERKMSQKEADVFLAAFQTGGAAGLRKALVGIAPTGSVQFGPGRPTPTRLTLERTTDKGRLITIVSDTPILFLGAGIPSAKPKTGYDFAVIDLEVDSKGAGSGTIAPAAKVTIKQSAFVVEDYGNELIRLTGVTKK